MRPPPPFPPPPWCVGKETAAFSQPSIDRRRNPRAPRVYRRTPRDARTTRPEREGEPRPGTQDLDRSRGHRAPRLMISKLTTAVGERGKPQGTNGSEAHAGHPAGNRGRPSHRRLRPPPAPVPPPRPRRPSVPPGPAPSRPACPRPGPPLRAPPRRPPPTTTRTARPGSPTPPSPDSGNSPRRRSEGRSESIVFCPAAGAGAAQTAGPSALDGRILDIVAAPGPARRGNSNLTVI